MADKTFHSIKFPGLPDTYKIPDIVNEYSPSSTYAVGDYVLKDGKTYKCTTAIASSGEAWNTAHWTEVKVGNDLQGKVADLKSALNKEDFKCNIINDKFTDFENGYSVEYDKNNINYTIGPDNVRNKFYATNSLPVIEKCSVTVSVPSFQVVFANGWNAIGSWRTGQATLHITDRTIKLGFWVRKTDSAEITESDISSILTALTITYSPENIYDNETFTTINNQIAVINSEIDGLTNSIITQTTANFNLLSTVNFFVSLRASTQRYVWNNGGNDTPAQSYIMELPDKSKKIVVESGNNLCEVSLLTSISGISNLSNVNLCENTAPVTIQAGNTNTIIVPADCKYICITKYKYNATTDYTPTELIVYHEKSDVYRILYVATNGDDNASGLSPNNALRTIKKAIESNADIIIIETGTYNEDVIAENSWYRNRKITIIGNDVRINIDNGLCFVNCDVEISGLHIDLTNSELSSTYAFLFTNCTGSLTDCESIGAKGAGGFRIDSSIMTLNRCSAHDGAIDGFNGHTTVSGVHTICTLNNCTAYNNGDDGASIHENGKMYINGGEYYDNVQTGLAPHNNCYFEAYNVHCHNNRKGIEALKDDAGTGVGKVVGCILENNTLYGLDVQYYTVYAVANGYANNGTNKHTGTGGVLNQYTAE